MNRRLPTTTLVSMPWANLHMPSIQLGTLEALLRRHELPVRTSSLYVHFMEFLRYKSSQPSATFDFTVDDYYLIADGSFLNGMGDWVFAGEPYAEPTAADVESYLRDLARYATPRAVEACRFARSCASEFIALASQAILKNRPDIVGFTTTFAQNVAALSLAKAIKTSDPDVLIVFGGANCESGMGQALIESFPWIDYIVRGEGEYALPKLINAIAGEGAVHDIEGLCYRVDGRVVVQPFKTAGTVKIDDVPEPIYDEYFEFMKTSTFGREIRHMLQLPVESSRGCWWGEKHHCTFCGLNGLTMSFRSKTPEKFLGEVASLSEKYAQTNFQCADNILDMRYFKDVIPALAESRERGFDFTFFYEVKANLKKEHIALLSEAGVKKIQPGIESLSSNILKCIDKGVTGIQNIALLKWAREYGVGVEWNLIYGFPGETEADWDAIYELIPLISHLQPPSLIPLLLERFSPYFDAPEKYEMKNLGPKPWYKSLYPVKSEVLGELAYFFDHESPRTVGRPTLDKLQARLDRIWNRRAFEKNEGTLTYTCGPGFVDITDRRAGLAPRALVLRGLIADVFIECDSVRAPQVIAATLGVDDERVHRICDELRKAHLMIEEGGKYLALPTAVRPRLARPRAAKSSGVPAHAL